MLSAGVRNVEPDAVKMKVADLGVPHVHDAHAVSHICARPKFAEAFAFDVLRKAFDHSVKAIEARSDASVAELS